jgi:DNA-binding winged helix-turn-helix (wHTH) protein
MTAFDLGAARVRPAYREVVVGPAGVSLQPRVMQVLVCLAQGGGEPVSREVVAQRCWGGVAVSEDAINRCIQRLRRLSEEEAADSFVIETIPRVGFACGRAIPRRHWASHLCRVRRQTRQRPRRARAHFDR